MNLYTNLLHKLPTKLRSNSSSTFLHPSTQNLKSSFTTHHTTSNTQQQPQPNPQNKFDFKTYMLEKIAVVNHALDTTIPFENPIKLHEAMRYSLLSPGKRICPIVCLASCHLVGGNEAAAMPAACALEMIHAMSLVHDDLPCMDDAALRRGRPSCHSAFGEPAAVLAGYSLLARAFELIAAAPRVPHAPPDRVLSVVGELARLIGPEGVVAGQVVDLQSGSGGDSIGLERLEYIHLRKTAAMVEASAVAGAVIGGAREKEVEALRRYSRSVGLMHQVVDDILDVTGSAGELGKASGKDAAAEKATFAAVMGVEGSRAYAERLREEATAELTEFAAERAAPLVALAEYIAHRQK